MGNQDVSSQTIKQAPAQKEDNSSRFTGGAFANFFLYLTALFVSLITLGLAYPAMCCWRLRWTAKHTYINGHRLVFDGNITIPKIFW